MEDRPVQQGDGSYTRGQEGSREDRCVSCVSSVVRYLSVGPDLIISTPLRLVASLQAGNLELDKYVSCRRVDSAALISPRGRSVRHIVLDEADRMLDAEFLEQVQEVIAACTHPEVQKAVFSATLPANAEKVAMSMLRDPIRVVVGLK